MKSTLQHDKVGEGKSTRLLRFSSMSGKDVRASRSKFKAERSSSNLPTIQRKQKLCGIDGEPIELERNISQDSQHYRFSRRFKTNWPLVKQVQKKLKIESSSCRRSTTLMEQKKKILKKVFRIPIRSKITQKGFRVDIGHSSVQEKKKDRMERTPTNLRDSGI